METQNPTVRQSTTPQAAVLNPTSNATTAKEVMQQRMTAEKRSDISIQSCGNRAFTREHDGNTVHTTARRSSTTIGSRVGHSRRSTESYIASNGTSSRPSTTSCPQQKQPHIPHELRDITCYSKEDIEQACAREGQCCISQSTNTPFLQGSLLQDLGFLATQSTVDCILSGTYQCKDDVDQHTQ